ncbi:ZmpA/ZmpB/ZmpC family metallo-endopeptidase-related protein, partial [Salinisphaera sp. G21_0]|uniref:ZmpA/ZmpB/ZmpC family metallo-endopeptidase-related protein n=1 Tax=Salinisphaera sp. G21_0 TaxID=2821094 RepID=UPI001ADA0E43
MENTKDKARKASQNLRHQYDKSAAPTLPASQLPNTPLALGALVGLSVVGAASASASDWINVTDAKTLGDICHVPKLPCDRQYRLVKNIDGSQLSRSIGTETNRFTGKLDGNCRTISNLSKCLVKNLAGDLGRIENLTLSDANIASADTVGVVACEMFDKSEINNIRIERANVITNNKKDANAAIGVGRIHDKKAAISNMTALNCTVKTNATDGYAGIGAGLSKGKINNIMAVNCHVETMGNNADAGIGVGRQQGKDATVTSTIALDCTVKTNNANAGAGIGAGSSMGGDVSNTLAVNCHVETIKKGANAGIGAGSLSRDGTVKNTTALNCTVKTSGEEASAGIGAGLLWFGTVDHTRAVDCTVKTSGEKANAGIGAGYIKGKQRITNTRVINSTVVSNDTIANAGILGGAAPVICNVTVNGEQQTDTAKGCQYRQHNDLCAVIDLIDPDLAKLNLQIANYCPAPPTTETVAKTPGSTMNSFSSGSDTTTTPPTTMDTAPDTTMNSFSSDSVTTTTPPTTMATAPDTTMNSFSSNSVTTTTPPTSGPEVQKVNFSDPGSATFAAPSPAIIACIATLGTVIIVLVGVIAYRYYSQRSSTNAGRNRAEPMPPPPSSRPRAEGQLVT